MTELPGHCALHWHSPLGYVGEEIPGSLGELEAGTLPMGCRFGKSQSVCTSFSFKSHGWALLRLWQPDMCVIWSLHTNGQIPLNTICFGATSWLRSLIEQYIFYLFDPGKSAGLAHQQPSGSRGHPSLSSTCLCWRQVLLLLLPLLGLEKEGEERNAEEILVAAELEHWQVGWAEAGAS